MMKFLLSKHSRSIFIFALLSLFLCMAAGKASAKERNPVVKIDNTSYTSSGTEVTLKLWMYNDYYSINIRDFCARFTGDVNLYIDDKEVVKLNTIWSSIADATRSTFIKIPTDNPVDINIDGINVGTALFNNLQNLQTCPDNSNTTEKNWWTVDLKLSFNKSFSYYGHKITVKGKWQDQGSGSLVTKDVALDNIINGFVRPINLKAQPSGGNMVFSWEQEGYNPSASTLGKLIVYKREGDNNVKLGEAAANEHSLSIEKKQYSCSKDYIMTFLPNVCEGEETVCGLTTTFTATGHQINDDDICQICGHSFFRYHTSNGNIVDISNKDFGANVVSHEVINHEVINCECVIEFDAPITRIPAQAFSNSKIFGDLVIPNSVTTIDDYAFSNCYGLNGSLTLSNSLKTIGYSAFYWCSELKGNLTLPDSVTTIGDNAFCNCYKFTGNLTIPNSVTTIGQSAFSNCSRFNGNLTLPNSVTTIGPGAFSQCFRFTGNLTLPNSVTTLGDNTFYGCSGFTNLKLSEKLSIIPYGAFSGCTNLSGELVIPASVKEIGNTAFCNCSGFTGNLTIPNSVTTIGESAFYKCTGFTGKLTIPNSVTTIGKMAFYECSGFTGDLTIPNSVTTIETSTFEYCTGFKGKLTIPNSVTTIGEHAFNECSGFTGNLTIPNSVTTIGHLAFGACSGFTGDVSLPKSLEILGSTSFKACKKIKTIKFQSLPTVLKGSLDDYKAIVSLSDDSYISPEVSGTVNEISYTRQISNNWGTLVLPYPLKLTGSEPYRLYNIETVSDDELVLKQLDGEVASGTPCVVKRKGSEAELTFSANNAELNMAINDQPMDGMYFSGTYWTKDVNNGYIIAKDCFWNVAELNKSDLVKGVKVKPFRAWLDGTSPNGASQLSICVSDTATGIGAAGTIDVLNDTATEYYDLSGKRLDEPQRGVNIVRMKSGKTKKIIIK
ncbi:leucine-rich repeat domain-containing protein [Prevotella sp.]|uniref:leucine-rich repeat domain-containing protein n=1 Tax=Prevotella sp. TaxID=59823 RepID=UPI003AB61E67